jgi:hypothetical protein
MHVMLMPGFEILISVNISSELKLNGSIMKRKSWVLSHVEKQGFERIPEIGVTISAAEPWPCWTFRTYHAARSLVTPRIRRQGGLSR